jgi:hypothetical protein
MSAHAYTRCAEIPDVLLRRELSISIAPERIIRHEKARQNGTLFCLSAFQIPFLNPSLVPIGDSNFL